MAETAIFYFAYDNMEILKLINGGRMKSRIIPIAAMGLSAVLGASFISPIFKDDKAHAAEINIVDAKFKEILNARIAERSGRARTATQAIMTEDIEFIEEGGTTPGTYRRLSFNNLSGVKTFEGLKPIIENMAHNKTLISLNNSDVTDFSFLNGINADLAGNIEVFFANGNNKLVDISALSQLYNLKQISINAGGDGGKITDLKPFQGMTSIESLSLTNQSISDLSPIKNLNTLTALYLNKNRIQDISPIANILVNNQWKVLEGKKWFHIKEQKLPMQNGTEDAPFVIMPKGINGKNITNMTYVKNGDEITVSWESPVLDGDAESPVFSGSYIVKLPKQAADDKKDGSNISQKDKDAAKKESNVKAPNTGVENVVATVVVMAISVVGAAFGVYTIHKKKLFKK